MYIDILHKHTDVISVILYTGVTIIYVIYCLTKGVMLMGRTSSVVKERYNAKAYDRHTLRFHKGQKEVIQTHAAAQGKSLNGYIVGLIEKDMQSVKGKDFSLSSNKSRKDG
jgi:hypothetical protein